jgi:hypothetical protein
VREVAHFRTCIFFYIVNTIVTIDQIIAITLSKSPPVKMIAKSKTRKNKLFKKRLFKSSSDESSFDELPLESESEIEIEGNKNDIIMNVL